MTSDATTANKGETTKVQSTSTPIKTDNTSSASQALFPEDFPPMKPASPTKVTSTTTTPKPTNISTPLNTVASPNMPAVVNIFVLRGDRNDFVDTIDRKLVTQHSKTVRKVLEANPGNSDVVLMGVGKEAVDHILQLIKKGRRPLRIGISKEPFQRGVAILQALNAMQVEPPQPQVEGHIIYAITQSKVTAAQVDIIGRTNNSGIGPRVYRSMVQAVAYNAVHGWYTAEEMKGLKDVATKHDGLDGEIGEKFKELKRAYDEHRKKVEAHRAGQAGGRKVPGADNI